MKILFVCTGNTCRSSMANALAEKILADYGQADLVTTSSRGTMAWTGQEASPKAVAVMRKYGLDLSSHRAILLTAADIDQADLIIAMTESHKQQIIGIRPEAAAKITVLNISDPFGGTEDDYEACAEEITRHLKRILAGAFSG